MTQHNRYQDYSEHEGRIEATYDAFERLIKGESQRHYEFMHYDPASGEGTIVDMTGSSPAHADLSGNMYLQLRRQLKGSGPCRVYMEQYVIMPGEPSSVPDIVVTCDVNDYRDKTSLRIRSPELIVEVLSPSTEKFDRTEKFERYKKSETFNTYILVHQDRVEVEVYTRQKNWEPEIYTAGSIKIDFLDLEIDIDELYTDVDLRK
ncbi:Uma2 family endonuclease [Thermosporothrix hazakensis]|jgi:Uma2 family endonuclease|uniref:Uma2 family endonuclease n=1 Tax=Thermosporothrix hazakensis TaxID=644383 RepID=A0A326UEY0_THEHA|nr:Uma2 family endonuclease [Thermosporothrix hazakensis]PZW25335.1 Uma2 family endonuclease [Thermosporothrix hazakensis]GCE50566.1 hypothetical protein KTH_54350 [Thermosporothrix hazakensis]